MNSQSFSSISDVVYHIISYLPTLKDLISFISSEKAVESFYKIRTDLLELGKTNKKYNLLSIVLTIPSLAYLVPFFEDFFVPVLDLLADNKWSSDQFTVYLSSLANLPLCDVVIRSFVKNFIRLSNLDILTDVKNMDCKIIPGPLSIYGIIALSDNVDLMESMINDNSIVDFCDQHDILFVSNMLHKVCMHGSLVCFDKLISICANNTELIVEEMTNETVLHICPDDRLSAIIRRLFKKGIVDNTTNMYINILGNKIDIGSFVDHLFRRCAHYGKQESIQTLIEYVNKNTPKITFDFNGAIIDALEEEHLTTCDYLINCIEASGDKFDINTADNYLMVAAIRNDIHNSTSIYSQYLLDLAAKGYGTYTPEIMNKCGLLALQQIDLEDEDSC